MTKERSEKQIHIFAFETWFQCDESYSKALETLKKQTPPYNISLATLYSWSEIFLWKKRSAERRQEALRIRSEQSVKEQVAYLRRKAQMGKLLQREALQFLDSKSPLRDPQTGNPVLDIHGKQVMVGQGIKSDYAALQALKMGFDLEGQALGMPEWITELLDADEDKLRRVYSDAITEFASIAAIDGLEGDSTESLPTVELGLVSRPDPN